jgi:hypothetical protein
LLTVDSKLELLRTSECIVEKFETREDLWMREISIDVMAVLFEDEPLQPLCAAICDIPNIKANDL